jgi:hypothetical protein
LPSKAARERRTEKFIASHAQKQQLSLAEAHHFGAFCLTSAILGKLTAANQSTSAKGTLRILKAAQLVKRWSEALSGLDIRALRLCFHLCPRNTPSSCEHHALSGLLNTHPTFSSGSITSYLSAFETVFFTRGTYFSKLS